MRSASVIFLFQVLAVISALGQKTVIRGRVLDAETGDPVPYVSIVLPELNKGTASNIDGEFQFRVDSLPLRITFSHISYETFSMTVTNGEPFTVRLQPRKILMHEVVVEEDRMNDYLKTLLQKAYNHTLQTSKRDHYGRAFYRQISKNGKDYSELYEIFYDTRFNTAGIEDWAIQEGRYALKTAHVADEYIYNKNFTLLSRVLSVVQLPTKDIIQPVNPQVALYYDLKMEHLMDMDGRKVAVISFVPKPDLTIPAMEGELYIDIDRYDILKMKGRIKNDKLKFITLSTKEGSWKNYTLSFDMAFKTGPDSTLVLDYITLDQSFDFYLRGVFMNPVKTRAFLVFYEYYQPERKKHLGGRLVRYNRRDRDVLDEMGYNPLFWADNPVVKRTPIEEEVIKTFEDLHAFGSIYLNNRQQLVLEGNELAGDVFVVSLTKALKRNGYAFTGEKVYLHLDKPFYAAGETIWFSVYLVRASTHLLTPSSAVLYVELMEPEGRIALKKRVYLKEGQGRAQMEIPADWAEGTYQLLAYTNWMRNFDHGQFFSRKINIYRSGRSEIAKSPSSKDHSAIDLQFFPEGGDLIGGIPALLAFKAIGADGMHAEVKGNIYDSSGKKVAEFKTTRLGMGRLIFSPVQGESYYALITGDPDRHPYPLPEVKREGFSMMVNNLKPRGVELLIKTSPEHHDASFYLIARMRGIIYHRYKGRFQNRVVRLEIPKSKLPDGVLQVTLFDENEKPRCERLVFINNYQNPVLSLRTGGSGTGRGQGSSVWLSLRDQDGKPVRNAALSVSVTSTQWVPYNRYQENIYTYLLLNGDLKGCIEDPDYYFTDDSRERQMELDLVMLTHGWRRFTWSELLKAEKPEYKFHHQQSLIITGKAVMKSNGKPASNVYMNFIPLSGGFRSGVISTSTDASGRFRLQIPEPQGDGRYAVNATNARNKQIDVRIIVDSPGFPEEKGESPCAAPALEKEEITAYLEAEQKSFPSGRPPSSGRVPVKNPPEEGKAETSHTGIKNAKVVADFNKQANNYGSVIQMLQSVVPGLQVTGSENNLQMSLRGSGMVGRNQSPLIVLDGTVIVNPNMMRSAPLPATTQNNDQSQQNRTSTGRENRQSGEQGRDVTAALNDQDMVDNSMQYSVLSSIPAQDIERVEVLKGASGVGLFGSGGENGVILLYSKKGNNGSTSADMYKNFEHVTLPGFEPRRKFYAPAYESDGAEKGGFVSTLYWLPDAMTDNRGRVRLRLGPEMYRDQQIRIEVQGLTSYGVPVSGMLLLGHAPEN